MRGIAAHFDAASEVRIVGEGTDLRLSLEGRSMKVDALGANLPGGEFFGCPIEDSAEGEISFDEFPAVYRGREITRDPAPVRRRARRRRICRRRTRRYLIETLDTDEGARRLGELGIGCNPGITRYMKNTLFDEKMDGTVHLALGNSYTDLGGVNTSAIHWDLVKDLRLPGSRIELDGVVVQQRRRLARLRRWLARRRTASRSARRRRRHGHVREHVLPEVLEHPGDRPEVDRAAEVERARGEDAGARLVSRSTSSRRSGRARRDRRSAPARSFPGGESGGRHVDLDPVAADRLAERRAVGEAGLVEQPRRRLRRDDRVRALARAVVVGAVLHAERGAPRAGRRCARA